MNPATFTKMGLESSILKALEQMGYTTPSPIQEQAIPKALTGIDLIGQAQTGTGKTAAFGIPMIQNISKGGKFTKGLVLCPTRELCLQVANELGKLALYTKGVKVYAVYGGDPITTQIKALKSGVDIVVGTPGRVQDHINRRTLQLDQLEMLTLDEADEMLNMGFREDIENILQSVPANRQTILFSATMPKPILEITKLYQRDPELIKITPEELTADNIEQYYIETDLKNRILTLEYLLNNKEYRQAIIFCNTKAKVDELSEELATRQIKNNVLHGDLTQVKRNKILTRYRNGEFKVLIATDVAARGIDVSSIDMVVNYDVPFDPEYYVHRIGRTGRAGNTGTSYSLIAGGRDKRLLRQIENFSKSVINRFRLPDARELAAMEMTQLKSQILHILENKQEQEYISLAKELVPPGSSTLEAMAAVLVKFIPPKQVSYPKSETTVPAGKKNKKEKVNKSGFESFYQSKQRKSNKKNRNYSRWSGKSSSRKPKKK